MTAGERTSIPSQFDLAFPSPITSVYRSILLTSLLQSSQFNKVASPLWCVRTVANRFFSGFITNPTTLQGSSLDRDGTQLLSKIRARWRMKDWVRGMSVGLRQAIPCASRTPLHYWNIFRFPVVAPSIERIADASSPNAMIWIHANGTAKDVQKTLQSQAIKRMKVFHTCRFKLSSPLSDYTC